MENQVLIVIDMQNDFVSGSLGTKEAQALLPELVKTIAAFEGLVIFTKDTHEENYLETQEGRLLPVPHTIRGTQGWELVPELEALRAKLNALVFEKPTFGCVELAEYLREKYERGEIDRIELCGVCTDICVVSNALLIKAFIPECPIVVLQDLCAGVTPAKHQAALEVMGSCQVTAI